jgi:hypothetical protein
MAEKRTKKQYWRCDACWSLFIINFQYGYQRCPLCTGILKETRALHKVKGYQVYLWNSFSGSGKPRRQRKPWYNDI